MKLSESRNQVIEMGIRLLETGLIARTWGNVSARVDENHFVITPSGRDYTDLKPEEIVIVNISDGRSWGTVRPSSEVGVHLVGYRNHPDANFIIHTHQPEASVLSALEVDLDAGISGLPFKDVIPCAAYGFPGTDELRDNVEAVIKDGSCRGALMAHHGALCIGGSPEDALRLSVSLEMLAAHHIRAAFEEHIGRPMTLSDSIYHMVLEEKGAKVPETVCPFCRSERRGDDILYHLPDGETLVLGEEGLTREQRVHRRIYEARPDIGGIIHSLTPSLISYSGLAQPLAAYLDDFAQINGVEMACAPLDEDAIVAALGENHGVLLADNAALCCGKNLYDAEALEMVAEKNARSYLIGQFYPGCDLRPVPREECEKMRRFYLESYSKRF